MVIAGLQFSIKCNISIADEQKYISQMYAIDFYVKFKHLMLKLFTNTIKINQH